MHEPGSIPSIKQRDAQRVCTKWKVLYRNESGARKSLAKKKKGLFQAGHPPLGGKTGGLMQIALSSFWGWRGPM